MPHDKIYHQGPIPTQKTTDFIPKTGVSIFLFFPKTEGSGFSFLCPRWDEMVGVKTAPARGRGEPKNKKKILKKRSGFVLGWEKEK